MSERENIKQNFIKTIFDESKFVISHMHGFFFVLLYTIGQKHLDVLIPEIVTFHGEMYDWDNVRTTKLFY